MTGRRFGLVAPALLVLLWASPAEAQWKPLPAVSFQQETTGGPFQVTQPWSGAPARGGGVLASNLIGVVALLSMLPTNGFSVLFAPVPQLVASIVIGRLTPDAGTDP